ncbi:ATP-binding protein [Cellulomonas sp. PhB150]|uniref:sensor histidine kinase n=1 Tax=Cellulomonas sp. PhB150 TaxID=2485188 RepID=UPI000FA2C8FC|nr:sensor histidine kinase [Cellulomonas sp. PhB150]ROS28197.1 phospho-acceptor domain-containing protein [Cellulomonas sp. PhB150]
MSVSAPALPVTSAAPGRTGMTLRRRLTTLLVVAGVVLGLLLAGAAYVFAQLADRQSAVTEDIFGAVVGADRALVAYVDAETGLRGFALTGDEDTLAPYTTTVEALPSFTDLADDLAGVSTEPRLNETAAAADAAARAWIDDYAEPLIAQVRSQGSESVTAAEVEAGKQQFDVLRADVTAFTDEVGDVRRDVAAELAQWTRYASVVVALLAIAAVTVGILLWTALRRWVVEPLDDLAADARIVSDGDLTHPVTATGPGEIADLARDVESMRTALLTQVQAVEEQHARLEDQAEELRRSNRDLEQFAYVASHDLQEPLRKVASFTQLLQKRYGGQMDERADQYIEFAVDGAKRMQRLIQDLLGFSRVGRVGGEVTDVDLNAALAVALDNLEQTIADAGAVITHDELPTVRGELPLVVQLFQNLVGNAVKFRAPDRVPQIHLGARRVEDSSKGEWELRCQDNGIGIDAQYADRVFVIFQRLHAKDVYEGTGIGLALCKKIVEFHGGQIWIDPPAGEGTSIRWTLPAGTDD